MFFFGVPQQEDKYLVGCLSVSLHQLQLIGDSFSRQLFIVTLWFWFGDNFKMPSGSRILCIFIFPNLEVQLHS